VTARAAEMEADRATKKRGFRAAEGQNSEIHRGREHESLCCDWVFDLVFSYLRRSVHCITGRCCLEVLVKQIQLEVGLDL
jgi:hypothetical protein